MKEISVAFDREIFLLQNFGGVSKSFVKNIEVMEENVELGILPLLTFSRSNNRHLLESNLDCVSRIQPARRFIQPKNGLETTLTLGPIRAVNSLYAGGINPYEYADIGHATYYRPQKYDFKKIKRLVVSVHDFIPEHLNWKGVRNPHIGKSKLIRSADLVVCVSETTRNNLYEKYGRFHDNVVVVPHGADITQREYRNGEGFPILYIGHRRGYKNFDLLVDALSGLNKIRPFELWIAGPSLAPDEITELNLKLPGCWKIFENPSDLIIKQLLSRAGLHCVTSKMEGFGMTAIEAFGAGCPVVASDIAIFRETLGEHGILFDPNNSEHLRDILILLMTNQTYYQDLEDNIIRRREIYSWEKITPKLTDAYRKLL